MRWLIPHSRGGMVWRFLGAAVVVIAATAATTAVAGLLQVNDLVDRDQRSKGDQDQAR